MTAHMRKLAFALQAAQLQMAEYWEITPSWDIDIGKASKKGFIDPAKCSARIQDNALATVRFKLQDSDPGGGHCDFIPHGKAVDKTQASFEN